MSGQDIWEEIGDAELIRWDEPKIVTGVYQGYREVPGFGTDEKRQRHTIVTEDGPRDFFAPSILARLLEDPRVEIGREIQIEYTGKKIKTRHGHQAKEFAVRVRR